MPRKIIVHVLTCFMLGAAPGWAKDASPAAEHIAAAAPSAWEREFAAFASSDAEHPPAAGGILFVGSSTIRLWSNLEAEFGAAGGVLKRGFGGSQLGDCVKNLNRLVVQYRPRTVLVYAGDNDLAAGVAPEEVRRRFQAFVEGVRRDLPATRIAYISIKPSPLRASLLPLIRATNDLVRAFAAQQARVEYIDVFTPMLDAAGAPRRELFREDALHLNAAGYALWKRVISPYAG